MQNANIHLVEELCTKPTSCFTIFLADQTTQEFNQKYNLYTDEKTIRTLKASKFVGVENKLIINKLSF